MVSDKNYFQKNNITIIALLDQSLLRLDIRRKFFMLKMAEHRNRLPREEATAPSLFE